jgi:Fic family protein
VASATKALAELNASPPRLASLESLARNLLQSEAVASSRIEGLKLSHKRLARAAYGSDRRGDHKAAEVLANVEAMDQAVALGASAHPLEVKDVESIHDTLMHRTHPEIAGRIRDKQNWVGGSDYHPLDAEYVPPPPGEVNGLMEDLCAFAARDDFSPLAQAAVVHAQFETIHPFADGNGRVGRALIHSVLRRRGEVPRYIPPISLVLANEPRTYVGGLVDYREGRVSEWCSLFASATERAAREAARFSEAIENQQAEWLERLGNPRKDAVVRELIALLPSHPLLDVAAGQQLTGKSHVAVGNALKQLEDAGIVRSLNEKRWGRVWECDPLLDLVTEFERTVSAP